MEQQRHTCSRTPRHDQLSSRALTDHYPSLDTVLGMPVGLLGITASAIVLAVVLGVKYIAVGGSRGSVGGENTEKIPKGS
ncbi:MAG: hypothetical protein J7J20_06085 [Desulfurococcales archaeon]|nr:hypothetical protein [Desulfurococcales archaeon]